MTTDTGSRAGRWLCGFHPAPRRPTSRLLMLPHAGGSASFYFPFSEALSGDVDVLVAQYPGRQERHREPSITDIQELAVAVLAALTADGLDDVPLALFGHSMGALVAYEMAGLLEERGVPVARLFVSGCRGAAVPDDPRRLHADDDALMAELAAMGEPTSSCSATRTSARWSYRHCAPTSVPWRRTATGPGNPCASR